MIIEILIIYLIFLLLVLVGNYYINIFLTQEQYSKEEMKNILPYLSQFWDKINKNYSLLTFFIILTISSFLGLIIPMLSSHWIANSSIFFMIIFFLLPYIKKYYEQSQVTSSDNYSDTITNIFVKYSDIIKIGFGTGLGTALMLNWRLLTHINSILFLLNILIIAILLGISLKKIINDE